MSKLIAGVITLVLFSAATIMNAVYLDNEIKSFIVDVEEASVLMDEGKSDDSLLRLHRSMDKWIKRSNYTYLVLHHSKVDRVADAYFEYISAIINEKTNNRTLRDKLIYHLKGCSSSEKISLVSIF